MLRQFLISSRSELIRRCQDKVALRSVHQAPEADVESGIPHFVDQLIATLRREPNRECPERKPVRVASDGAAPAKAETRSASAHRAGELPELGFSIDQVVHGFGTLRQAITDVATERGVALTREESRSLNRWLDIAIVDCITELHVRRTALVADTQRQTFHHQLGVMAHELRNHIHTATRIVDAVKSGRVPLAGGASAVLSRGLVGMSTIIDDCLAEVLIATLASRRRPVAVADLMVDLEVFAALHAHARDVTFHAAPVDPRLTVDVDRELVASALQNVLQNAFKFTRSATEVRLHAYGIDDRVRIDVEDHCGGLPVADPGGTLRPVRATRRRSLGTGPRAFDQPAQRGGPWRDAERPRRAGMRVRVHSRAASLAVRAVNLRVTRPSPAWHSLTCSRESVQHTTALRTLGRSPDRLRHHATLTSARGALRGR